METFLEKSSKMSIKSILKPSVLFVFMVLSAIQSMAQSDAMTEVQKKAEHQEFLSYVFMVVGFVAIIAIAWFSVKKKSGENTNHHHHHPAHHHHHHGSHDKRYGTHHAK